MERLTEKQRTRLIESVVSDLQNTCDTDREYLYNLLRFGHASVEAMSDGALLDYAHDYLPAPFDLDGDNDETNDIDQEPAHGDRSEPVGVQLPRRR